jgi:hypothetical protein
MLEVVLDVYMRYSMTCCGKMRFLLINFILDAIHLFTEVDHCCLKLKNASIHSSDFPIIAHCHKFNDLKAMSVSR